VVQTSADPEKTRRPLVVGRRWAITADHPLATAAGAEILRTGGSAAEAAVAAAGVLAVVQPHMCGVGGDLWALIYDAQRGQVTALNASGRAPTGLTPQTLLDAGHTTMPEYGIYTITIPGAVDGWQQVLTGRSRRSLGELLQPAIHYARAGFPLYAKLCQSMTSPEVHRKATPALRDHLAPGGKPPRSGRLWRQPALANTLAQIARDGPEAFYRGDLAERHASFLRAQGGCHQRADFIAHHSTTSAPLTLNYCGLDVLACPPNSQGIALLMHLNILANADTRAWRPGMPEVTHYQVEALKLSFADRNRYVCDPAFVPVPVAGLLDPTYGATRFRLINPRRAASQVLPGQPPASGDTVYLSVVDAEGNAVSLIQSLYAGFGSGVFDPQTGVVFQNRGAGFTLEAGHPNCLAPGKRPYHTLTPGMVLQNGRPWLVFGSPGADGQTQTHLQLLHQIILFGRNPQAAIEAPRWRLTGQTLEMEEELAGQVADTLRQWGHQIAVKKDRVTLMGSAQAIRVADGLLQAGADLRRNAAALAGE